MTETLVTASTILVPLLLLIPLLGKYIDIKHAAIQAARYEAWEYTVWYADNGETSDGFVDGAGNTIAQRTKTPADLQQESRLRFFSDPRNEISPADITEDWSKENRNPLWSDHTGESLVTNDNNGASAITDDATPDYSLGILNTILDILDAVFEAISWAMNLVGSDVGFTMINTDGLARSNVALEVTAPEGLIDFPNLRDEPGIDDSTAARQTDFIATAAVLTDGWNAGGLGHTINQTGGLVPTKILAELISAIPGLDEVWDVVSLLVPEWRRCNPSIPHFLDVNYGTVAKWESGGYNTYEDGDLENNGSLWLGYMNIDAVHPDRLDLGDEEGSHDCPDEICNFDPEPVFADCDI